MYKKVITVTLTILILTSLFMIFNQTASSASTGNPSKLNISTGPTSVLADNNTYNCIYVQLQDSSGQPARALQDTTISLSSSFTNIGTVNPLITIPKNATFASANFTSTFTPGSTTISASATGYATIQASIITIGYIPSAIALYGFPPTLPADNNKYGAIMVQLQDLSGSPARAPQGGVLVSLSCSDTQKVGSVDSNVTIPEGQTYAIANFTTSNYAATETPPKPESAVITALTQGYTFSQLTITTTPVASNPTQIKIFTGPPQIPADQNSYPQIAIELQNASGYTAQAQSDIVVNLASSDQNQSIVKINSQITIPQFQTYAVAIINSTYKAGSSTLTAVATNILSDHQAITTVGFIPSKLAVYALPLTLPADNSIYNAIIVQLQDSQGRPAKDPQAEVSVNLFSSQPTIGNVGSKLIIPFGKTQAIGNFSVTNAPGTTIITAQTSGYTTGQAQITTYLIDFSPLQITLTASPQSVNNGNNANLTAYVTANGGPIAGAKITFTSNNGGSFTTAMDQGNGYYNTSFTAPSFTTATSCTITASGSKIGYLDAQGTTQVTVTPAPAPTPTPTATPTPSSALTPTNGGPITLLIENSEGTPMNNTLVSSTTQPAGIATLIAVTNASGYVTFRNATTGSYVFKIISSGYLQQNETIYYDGNTLTVNISLVRSSGVNSINLNGNDIIVISVAISSVVIAIVISMFLAKRKTSPNIQKLKDLKKQMNYKKEP